MIVATGKMLEELPMIRRIPGVFTCGLLAVAMAAPTGALAAEPTEAKTPATQAERRPEDDLNKPLKTEDKPRLLSEAIQQWRDKEYRQAGITFTRLINGSRKDELEALSAAAEKEAQMPLAELAADAHIEAAKKEQSKSGAISIRHVTPYEKDTLAKKIDELYGKALAEPISATPASQAAGTPAGGESGAAAPPEANADGKGNDNKGLHDANRRLHRGQPGGTGAIGRGERAAPGQPGGQPPAEGAAPSIAPVAINEFLNNPKEFSRRDTTPQQCAAFTKHISYAISLGSAKLQFDASLRTNKEEKTKLAEAKKKMTELRAIVEASARMTPAQRARMEQMRQRQEQMKQRKEQQPQRPPSGQPGPRSDLERAIRRSAGGYGVQ
jgi:hypothetical protein